MELNKNNYGKYIKTHKKIYKASFKSDILYQI